MEFTNNIPSTAEQYINCFRQLSALTHAGLSNFENKVDWVSENGKKKSLKMLAKSVDTISFLRGEGGVFIEFRPEGLIDYQSEM